jgi:hypothetical protein
MIFIFLSFFLSFFLFSAIPGFQHSNARRHALHAFFMPQKYFPAGFFAPVAQIQPDSVGQTPEIPRAKNPPNLFQDKKHPSKQNTGNKK